MIFRKIIFKYFMVGISCQGLDYSSTLLLFNLSNNLFLSNLIGYSFASSISYLCHTKFTFKKTSGDLKSYRQILLFISSCLIGSFLGYIFLICLINFNLHIKYSKILQLISIALFQYIFNSRITFKKF